VRKKTRDEAPPYRVWLKPSVHRARRLLPGNVRHRIRRLLDALGDDPRPANSRVLELPDTTPVEIRESWEVRRARLDDWRVVYAVNETWKEVGALLVARRPPYRYEDLEELLEELSTGK
jgi:mRNA-degrading endonuclease RelE of RelBE toxin-antitoxin system